MRSIQSSLLIGLALILAALVGLAAWFAPVGPSGTVVPAPSPRIPYLPGNPPEPLRRMVLSVVYAVPKDRVAVARADWRAAAENILSRVQRFYMMQFRGATDVRFTVEASPLVLARDGDAYDGRETAQGNPGAWAAVHEELNGRLGRLTQPTDGVAARIVFYEGVGALGGEDMVLLSSGYLATPPGPSLAAAVLAHEVGHILALPDEYDHTTGTSRAEGIMGLGRTKPIEQAFMSNEAERALLLP